MENALTAQIRTVPDAEESTLKIASDVKQESYTKESAILNAQKEHTQLPELAENAHLTVSLAQMEKTALNVILLLYYKENGVSNNAMTDLKMLKESALNALTFQELKDAPIHPNQSSADQDTSYQEETASKAALREQWLTPTESVNLAELHVSNALKRMSAKDVYQLTFSTTELAYPNVLPDSSTCSEFAILAHKTLVTNADLKTEHTVPTVESPSLLPTEFAFLLALLEDGETVTDAENAILHALLASKEAPALLASLNSPSIREYAFQNAHLEKSLFLEPVLLVKTLTA
jgi:hypothetical protein